jgi:hypothetical protein
MDARHTGSRARRACLFLAPVIGAWAVVPPYLGPKLDVATRVEVADHVVPGVAVLLASLATVLTLRRAQSAVVTYVAGLVILLAGLWMVATHLPLVRQAVHQEVPVGAVAFHAVPGLAVVALGSVWSVTAWSSSASSS